MFWKRKRREPEHVAALRKVVEDLASKVDDLSERVDADAAAKAAHRRDDADVLTYCGKTFAEQSGEIRVVRRDLDEIKTWVNSAQARIRDLENRPAPAVAPESVRSELQRLLTLCAASLKPVIVPVKSGTITIGDGPPIPVKSGTITLAPGAASNHPLDP